MALASLSTADVHAPGDFANAYVIAHEVGHHVQNLLGISIESEHRRLPHESQNQLSVRLELQADFLAGSGPSGPTGR